MAEFLVAHIGEIIAGILVFCVLFGLLFREQITTLGGKR